MDGMLDTDKDLKMAQTTLNENKVMLTFYNDYTVKSVVLEKKEPVLMKGQVKGKFADLKKCLAAFGIGVGIALTPLVVKGAREIIAEGQQNYINHELDAKAAENYKLYASALDTNVLIAFLQEVEGNLIEKERAATSTDNEVVLGPELSKILGEIEHYQLQYDQARAVLDATTANLYWKEIATRVEQATILCGDNGHMVGSSAYNRYLNAIYYRGQVMYLASDVEGKDDELDERLQVVIGDKCYVPTTPYKVAGSVPMQ